MGITNAEVVHIVQAELAQSTLTLESNVLTLRLGSGSVISLELPFGSGSCMCE